MNTKGDYYVERRDYVASLNKVLSVVPDFDKIVYVRRCESLNRDGITKTDSEYIKISSTLGYPIYLNVTRKSLYEIFCDVSKSLMGEEPDSICNDDYDAIRGIVPLIKEEESRQIMERSNKIHER